MTPRQYFVIMPFSRPHNLAAILASFELAKGAIEDDVALLLVCHENQRFDDLPPWAVQIFVTVPKGENPCYSKINFAINLLGARSSAQYVGFCCDDDTYDPGFFPAIDKINYNPVAIAVSANRHGPAGERSVLEGCPENMRECHVGLEQVFIRADILIDEVFRTDYENADGYLFERLHLAYQKNFVFFKDVFVNWNILPK